MSGWGCRHQSQEQCLKIGVPCHPGMRGCVLCGRVTFIEQTPASPPAPTRTRRKPRRNAGTKTR
jgi:hypothetical protein